MGVSMRRRSVRLPCTRLITTLALTFALFTEPANAEIRLGIGGSMTGPDAAAGQQLLLGAQQAVEDTNAQGGILGQKIVAEVGDDAGDPKQGVAVANKFVGDQVAFVIGHFHSGVTIPASAIYAENNILAITPASTNPMVTERGLDLIFRTCGRSDKQAEAGAKFIAAQKGKTIAILHDKTAFGKGIADETRESLEKLGVKPVLYDGINRGEKDYSAILSRVKASGADLLYFGGYYTEAGLLVRQMHDLGMKTALFGPSAMGTQEFASIAGDSAAGTFMTYGTDKRKRPEAQEIIERFKAKNFDAEVWTLYSYASMQVLKQAAETAQSLEPHAIATVIHSGVVFKTVIGDLSFDKKGDAGGDFTVMIWKKGADGRISYYEIEK